MVARNIKFVSVLNCSRMVSNETKMQTYLYHYSPLTVSVNSRSWQDYDGGFFQTQVSGKLESVCVSHFCRRHHPASL